MTAEDYLRLAIHTESPEGASVYAEKGLRAEEGRSLEPETALLLWREIFRSHLYARRLRSAHAVAKKMVRFGVEQEIAYADLGRVCGALGWFAKAAQAHRIAARNAPARRRSMHWAAAAAALHHAGLYDEALGALERAVRWSLGTRSLHRASAALVRLDRGASPGSIDDLPDLVEELAAARCGEGYGRYVLGMLCFALGDLTDARRHLLQFVRRNAKEPMRRSTLAAELRRARATLRLMKI